MFCVTYKKPQNPIKQKPTTNGWFTTAKFSADGNGSCLYVYIVRFHRAALCIPI